MDPKEKPRKSTIKIDGMHCASCDVLVRTKLKSSTHIIDVRPDFHTKTAVITHMGQLDLADINAILCEYGYTISTIDDSIVQPSLGYSQQRTHSSDITESLMIAGIVLIIIYMATELHISPTGLTSQATTIGGAFILGLIASASTCMATTGALFTAFMSHQTKTVKTVRVAVGFMIGRVSSYVVFGYFFGMFGKFFSQFIQIGSFLNVFIAIILVAVGLDMLKIISIGSIIRRLPGGYLIEKYEHMQVSSTRAPLYAALLGALTYLLPCGFTLTTQAYAISTGDPMTGALLMGAFALGTLPSLGLVTLISKIRVNTFYQTFLKVVGVIVIIVGLSYLANTAALYGYTLDPLGRGDFDGVVAEVVDGKQIVKMTATSGGYSPSQFTVRRGVPVRWEIDGKEIYGCQGSLQAPEVGVKLTYLNEGANVVEFTPNKLGYVSFSCSMGMFSGKFKVI